MRKAIIFVCGLLLLLFGAGGLFLPIFGYFWARDWASFVFTFGFPFFPVFYLPFAGWLLVTGVGLLACRSWAWYSVQAFWVFLLCVGLLALVSFNLLSPVLQSVVDVGVRLRMVINAVLGLLLVLLPVGGLVFFGHVRPLFTAAVEEPPWARWSAATEERWTE
ncbi:hypothetical protein [Capillibacterium thermochitinicola]|uniref:Uncharacterized protein n=1 Tax=Capillibacterium thermochitinicola TaxID=2699427 RepID=A0A8J6LL14_9FIRM|nr:hypothetical protein [Capillibacterium thermochitinicola]MBA2132019.1 hypothetical protein [Capillibacterium thermochitinicola]